MATQSDGEFQEWLGKVMEQYTKLTDEQKNFTIDCLVACSGSSQLCHLHTKTSVLLHRDFLKLLPPELREHLLSFLDGETLLICCRVSKIWNEIISSSSRIWLRVCSASGLIVNRNLDNNSDAAYWKSFFLKMAKRRYQMKNFKCFTTKTYDRNLRRVTAVYYYKGKIATASDSKVIQIWNCVDDSCILTLRTDSSISTIKFDDNYIVAASYLGHIVSWDAVTGMRLLEFMRHSGVIFTLDYSTKLNIIVSGSADCLIKIWGLRTGFLYKRLSDHSCWVLKVILAPYPAEKESNLQERHLLLSMDKTVIVVRYLTFMTKCRSPDKLCMCTLYSISLGHPDDSGIFTPGLHFDGDFLYFPKESLDNRGSASLCKWDLKRKRMASELDLNLKVKALLGVGKKYIVVLTNWRQHMGSLPNFIVMDKENREKVAAWHVPPSQPTTPDLSQLCLGEKDWLDGLDGKNDQGVLLTAAVEENCVYVLKWINESDDMITC